MPIGDNQRYAFLLWSTPGGRARGVVTLRLLRVDAEPDQIIAEHQFSVVPSKGGRDPMRIERGFLLSDAAGGAAAIASVSVKPSERKGDARKGRRPRRQPRASDGKTYETFSACGWWLVPEKPVFVCAPKLHGPSSYTVRGRDLVETWSADPPSEVLTGPSRTGRVLQLSFGQWQEVDDFRCLGKPLDKAFAEAAGVRLRTWQHDMVQRLIRSARRAANAGDDTKAIRFLRDATQIDACDPELWRVLGRTQIEAGAPTKALPPLAAALALVPHSAPAQIDLADALAMVDTASAPAQEDWAQAKLVLSRRKATRALVDRSGSGDPRAVARLLYAEYLESTKGDAAQVAGARRRARSRMGSLPRPVNPGSRAPSPKAAQ